MEAGPRRFCSPLVARRKPHCVRVKWRAVLPQSRRFGASQSVSGHGREYRSRTNLVARRNYDSLRTPYPWVWQVRAGGSVYDPAEWYRSYTRHRATHVRSSETSRLGFTSLDQLRELENVRGKYENHR